MLADAGSTPATSTKILSEVIHRNLKKPLNSMFKGFFIDCIVRCCPKRFDPIFALCGSILGQFDPLNVSFRPILHYFVFYSALSILQLFCTKRSHAMNVAFPIMGEQISFSDHPYYFRESYLPQWSL